MTKLRMLLLAIAVVAGTSACQHRSIVDRSGCTNIEGIVGGEFRLDASAHARVPTVEGGAGLLVSWTYPEISREFRETLIMGTHLCHAAAAKLIHPKIYQEYLAKQLGGLGAVAIEASARSPDEVKSDQAKVVDRILALRAPALGGGYDRSQILMLSNPRLVAASAPFRAATDIYRSVEETLPPRSSNPNDVGYLEVSSRLEALSSELRSLQDRLPPALPQDEIQSLGHVTFAFNSAELDSSAKRELQAIFESAGPTTVFRVVGYADVTGSYEHNSRLTRRRTEAVSSFLRTLGARDAVVMIAAGRTDEFGQAHRENRRVVVQRVTTPR